MSDHQAILFHKQATSARTLFVRHADGSICSNGAFAEPAELLEDGSVDTTGNLVPHPTRLLRAVAEDLGMEPGALEFEPEFQARVAYGQHTAPVFLLRLTAEDPPRDLLAERGSRFIAIT